MGKLRTAGPDDPPDHLLRGREVSGDVDALFAWTLDEFGGSLASEGCFLSTPRVAATEDLGLLRRSRDVVGNDWFRAVGGGLYVPLRPEAISN